MPNVTKKRRKKEEGKPAGAGLGRRRGRREDLSEVFTAAERRAWAPPPKLKVSEWAALYRELGPKAGPLAGKYDPSFTPFACEPMDCYNDPVVEQCVLKFCTQVCKTEIHLNTIGYIIDQDPRSIGYALPTQHEVQLFEETRVRPMIEESEHLRRHFPPERHRIKNTLWNLAEMLVYFLWPTGGQFSGKPFPVFLFDEINKYNVMLSTTEGDPLKVGADRTVNFWNRYLLYSSSPTIGEAPISKKYDESDKSVWMVPCPSCGGYQQLKFREEIGEEEEARRRAIGVADSSAFGGQSHEDESSTPKGGVHTDKQGRRWVYRVRWPEGATVDDLTREEIAWYECKFCLSRIPNHQKHVMNSKGVWVPEGCHVSGGKVCGTSKIRTIRGFHLSTLVSPFPNRTFSKISAEFLSCKRWPALLRVFLNQWLAEDWEEVERESLPENIRLRMGDYTEAQIPAGVKVIYGAMDIQSDYAYVMKAGLGEGREVWLLDVRRIDLAEKSDADWKAAARYFFEGPTAVRRVAIDTGHRIDEVIDFHAVYKARVLPINGLQSRQGAPYAISLLKKDPRGKPRPRGARVYNTDTTYFKDLAHGLLNSEAFHAGSDTPDWFFEQCAAERKVVKRNTAGSPVEFWEPVTPDADNHCFDLMQYWMSAAEIEGGWDRLNRGKAAEMRVGGGGGGLHPPTHSHPRTSHAPHPPTPSPTRGEGGKGKRGTGGGRERGFSGRERGFSRRR